MVTRRKQLHGQSRRAVLAREQARPREDVTQGNKFNEIVAKRPEPEPLIEVDLEPDVPKSGPVEAFDA